MTMSNVQQSQLQRPSQSQSRLHRRKRDSCNAPVKVEGHTYWLKAKVMYINKDGTLFIQLHERHRYILERLTMGIINVELGDKSIEGICFATTKTGLKLLSGWRIK